MTLKAAEREPVGGRRSMIGPQALSTRATSPTPAFTRGGRTRALGGEAFEALQLGAASPGPAYNTAAAAGLGQRQVLSRRANAPSAAIAGRPDGALAAARAAALPGPGAYNTAIPTLAAPAPLSHLATSPAARIGRERRFPDAPKPAVASGTAGDAGVTCEPLLTAAPRLAAGALGDAPACTFHGGRPRGASPALLVSAAAACSGAAGGAADAPSFLSAPAPGAYAGAARSSFGPQLSSEARSAPSAALPRAGRDAAAKLAVGRGEEKALLGRTSAGPSLPQGSSLRRQLLSANRSTGGCGFGTAGRFCSREAVGLAGPRRGSGGGGGAGSRRASGSALDDQAATARRGPFDDVPGPGAYLV